jgi:endonuclease/exonuclease/phosphatase family metal-dependent hydrolase
VGVLALASASAVGLARAEPDVTARTGRLKLVTYNVAGLPEGLSAVHPERNLPLIGSGLARFDLALVQEDYAYPQLLRQNLLLPYATAPFERGNVLHFGDGLSYFAKLPLTRVTRKAWVDCHGVIDSYFDCLTPKGMAYLSVEVTPGVLVDVYNVHLDAGRGALDKAAREKQLLQLAKQIESQSAERAVIVAGDFNLTRSEKAKLEGFMSATRLRDACSTLRCPDPWRLDRVLLRSSPALRLTPKAWQLDQSFRDERGLPLSDHLAVSVTVDWATVAGPKASVAPPH